MADPGFPTEVGGGGHQPHVLAKFPKKLETGKNGPPNVNSALLMVSFVFVCYGKVVL